MEKKKALIILFGESFRYGKQKNRNTGLLESYNEQINASKSHIKLILSLSDRYDIDVSINSYTTKYDNDLISIYDKYLIHSVFHKKLLGQNRLIKKYKFEARKYDFILYSRIDIFLKDKFFEIFNPSINKILFPSICYKPHHKIGGHPRVNDMMAFIPKKYFFYLEKFKLCHRSWRILIESQEFTYDDLDTMLNTYHDSDTYKDSNPIYYITNRKEKKTTRTRDIFNKYDSEFNSLCEPKINK